MKFTFFPIALYVETSSAFVQYSTVIAFMDKIDVSMLITLTLYIVISYIYSNEIQIFSLLRRDERSVVDPSVFKKAYRDINELCEPVNRTHVVDRLHLQI